MDAPTLAALRQEELALGEECALLQEQLERANCATAGAVTHGPLAAAVGSDPDPDARTGSSSCSWELL